MPIKKKRRQTENYYTNKKYDSPEPSYESTDYFAISQFYSDYEFSVRLAHKINKSLKKTIGNLRGTRVLEELKKGRIKIINEKTYLQYTQATTDLGTIAWSHATRMGLRKDSIWQFMSEVTRLMMQRLEKGEDHIDISTVLIYLSVFYKKVKKERIYYTEVFEGICSSLAGAVISGKKNPFVINLAHTIDISHCRCLG